MKTREKQDIDYKGNHIRSNVLPRLAVVIPAFRAEKHILDVMAGIPRFVTIINNIDLSAV